MIDPPAWAWASIGTLGLVALVVLVYLWGIRIGIQGRRAAEAFGIDLAEHIPGVEPLPDPREHKSTPQVVYKALSELEAAAAEIERDRYELLKDLVWDMEEHGDGPFDLPHLCAAIEHNAANLDGPGGIPEEPAAPQPIDLSQVGWPTCDYERRMHIFKAGTDAPCSTIECVDCEERFIVLPADSVEDQPRPPEA